MMFFILLISANLAAALFGPIKPCSSQFSFVSTRSCSTVGESLDVSKQICSLVPAMNAMTPGTYLSTTDAMCLCTDASCKLSTSVHEIPIAWVYTPEFQYITEPYAIQNTWARDVMCLNGRNSVVSYSASNGQIINNGICRVLGAARVLQAGVSPTATASLSSASATVTRSRGAATATATDTATRSRGAATATATDTATRSRGAATATATDTATRSRAPASVTSTVTRSRAGATPTGTNTITTTRSRTLPVTPTATNTITTSRSRAPASGTPTDTATRSRTATDTQTITATRSRAAATPTMTNSATATRSPTSTVTQTRTDTITRTESATNSATRTPVSASATQTDTASTTASVTAQATLSASISPAVTSFQLFIPGTQISGANADILAAINQFLGSTGSVSITQLQWNNGVYTVSGISASAPQIQSQFSSSPQYLNLLQQLSLSANPSPSPSPSQFTTVGIPVIAALGGVCVLSVAAGMYLYFRNRQKRRKISAVPTIMNPAGPRVPDAAAVAKIAQVDSSDGSVPVMMVSNAFNETLKDVVEQPRAGTVPVYRADTSNRNMLLQSQSSFRTRFNSEPETAAVGKAVDVMRRPVSMNNATPVSLRELTQQQPMRITAVSINNQKTKSFKIGGGNSSGSSDAPYNPFAPKMSTTDGPRTAFAPLQTSRPPLPLPPPPPPAYDEINN